MYRNKQSLLPVQYYNKLLKECNADAAIILAPVMATGRFQLQVVVAGNVANEGFALLIPFSWYDPRNAGSSEDVGRREDQDLQHDRVEAKVQVVCDKNPDERRRDNPGEMRPSCKHQQIDSNKVARTNPFLRGEAVRCSAVRRSSDVPAEYQHDIVPALSPGSQTCGALTRSTRYSAHVFSALRYRSNVLPVASNVGRIHWYYGVAAQLPPNSNYFLMLRRDASVCAAPKLPCDYLHRVD